MISQRRSLMQVKARSLRKVEAATSGAAQNELEVMRDDSIRPPTTSCRSNPVPRDKRARFRPRFVRFYVCHPPPSAR